jgi:hypothetical protein
MGRRGFEEIAECAYSLDRDARTNQDIIALRSSVCLPHSLRPVRAAPVREELRDERVLVSGADKRGQF